MFFHQDHHTISYPIYPLILLYIPTEVTISQTNDISYRNIVLLYTSVVFVAEVYVYPLANEV